MERLALICVVTAAIMVMIANYSDAIDGAQLLYIDLFGEEQTQ